MYTRILLPTDGSQQASAAASKGFDLALQFDAAVHIVSVVDAGPLGSIRLPGDAESAENVLTQRATEAVEVLASQARELDLDVVTNIRRGTPISEILSYAEEKDIELIVMGSRGRGGIDRMLLGSVTEGVTRYGTIDVLVIHRNGRS